MREIEVVELPTSGAFDTERATRADVLVHNAGGSRPPLFLVRTWSRNGLYLRDLAARLGPEQPVYTLAPPFFEQLADYPETVEQWADFMLARLDAIPKQDSYRIGGYSFGGLVALEMAERLAARGAEIPLVLLFDSWLPPMRMRTSELRKRRSTRLFRFARGLRAYAELPPGRERRAWLWHRLSPTQRAARREAGRRRRRRGGHAAFLGNDELPPGQIMKNAAGAEISFLERAVQVAYVKYTHRATDLPLALIRTRRSTERKHGDATLGWWRVARGSFRTLQVEGGHFQMFDPPYLPGIAREIDRILRDALPASQEEEPSRRA